MAIPGSWIGVLKLFNYVQRARTSFSYLALNAADRPYLFRRSCIGQCNAYTKDVASGRSGIDSGNVNSNPKKKKIFIPQITLLTENDEMSVVTLEMAGKIAKRRNLKLVNILDFDAKTERPIYKLMSAKAYIQEDIARKKIKKTERETSLKPEKLMSVSSKISDHDLQTKLNATVKFLSKKHEVRFVVLYDGNVPKSEAICTQLLTALKDLPVTIKKKHSNERAKFYLTPNIEEMMKNVSESKPKEAKDEVSVADGS